MKRKTVSLIVLNYNGRELLKDYFDSVYNQTMKPDEIIMFDNLCTDGSRKYVRENYPDVKIVAEDRFNTGTALAYNIAISVAKGDFVIISANDIVWRKIVSNIFMRR